KDYFNGFKAGLRKDNEKLIVQLATYEATDPTIDSQMIQLKDSRANRFFNITIPKFGAQAINKKTQIGWKTAHHRNHVTASDATTMKPAGLENGQGIITALYLKDITDPQWEKSPDFIAWKAFMTKYMPGADLKDQAHGYAWSVANTLVQVLKQCGDDLTRANI